MLPGLSVIRVHFFAGVLILCGSVYLECLRGALIGWCQDNHSVCLLALVFFGVHFFASVMILSGDLFVLSLFAVHSLAGFLITAPCPA